MMLRCIPHTHIYMREKNAGAKVLLFSDISKLFTEKSTLFCIKSTHSTH